MKDRIITIMCHAKNQFCNMNRFVLILLLSLFNFVGAYAYTNTCQTSGYPIRTVNKTIISTGGGGSSSAGVGTNMSRQVSSTQTRVSSNSFASVPSMQVNTIATSSSKYSQSGFIEPGSDSQSDGSRKIRGQQRALGEGDEGEDDPDKNDPYDNPLGDTVLPLLLLALGYAIYLRRKNRVQTPASEHQQ
jgi:hypothetical protein